MRHRSLGTERLAYRRVYTRELFLALDERDDPALFETRLRRLLTRSENLEPEAYREGMEHNQNVDIDLIIELQPTLTVKQQRKLRRRLGALAEDFEYLARQGP